MCARIATGGESGDEDPFFLIRRNAAIVAPEVRVFSPDGRQLGTMHIVDAIRRAQELNLDLVEVAPNAKPPVCRIMDFKKYINDQKD